MDMPRPAPEQQALGILVGDWLGREHVHPSPFDIKGGPAVARVRNRLALDGFAVVQDYEQERGGRISLRGHGVFQWDVLARQVALYWFDSYGMPPSIYRGALNDGVLQLTLPQGTGFSRATYDFTRPGAYTYRLEVSLEGKEWYPFTDGTFEKQT